MLKLDTSVKMAEYTWTTGKELINVEVTLGSAEKSSSCKVTLADLNHNIAEALINHSLKTGGIETLETPEVTKSSSVTSVGSGTAIGDTKGWASPAEHAFADACVKRETATATSDVALSYRAKNGPGYMSPAEIAPGAGFPASAGTTQNVGRYQFNRGDWSDAVRAGFAKDFTPADQDGIFRYKIYKLDRGGRQLQAGDISSAFDKASNEWVSIPWAAGKNGIQGSQVQAGTTKDEYLNYYKQQLATYGGNKQPVVATTPAKTPAAPSKTDTVKPVIKGSVITITINGYSFDFYHQGTETTSDGTTVLTGQGLRWLMSRRERSRTIKDTSLKQLATSIAKAHKVPLKYEATFDPSYDHLDQSGLSDYALLHREAYLNGLLVTEDKDGILVKELSQLGTPTYTLERGVNLVRYKMADVALSGSADDISTKLPTLQKVAIDPITGIVVNRIQDVDRQSSSNSITGKVKTPVKGTLKTKDSGTAQAALGKTKRVAGLPSTFVVPMSDQTLSFSPLTTMITKGFPGCLDRIWIVKSVSHSLLEGTSTLELNSPVEVKDTSTSQATSTSNVVPQSGDINDRIYRAALAARGKTSANDGTNGRYACAWAVNVLVLDQAGIRRIGSNIALVDSVRQALEKGRGTKVAINDARPGDILIMGTGAGGGAHIGIYLGNDRTLSNSSSKASFSWEASYAEYLAQPQYRGKLQYYRVLN